MIGTEARGRRTGLKKRRKTRGISFPCFSDGGVVEVRLQNNHLLWDKREGRSSVYPIYNSHLQIQFSRREKRHRDTARLSGNLKERDETGEMQLKEKQRGEMGKEEIKRRYEREGI